MFNVVLQIYCSPALLLFSSFTLVLPLYYYSPALEIKLENNSKTGEQYTSWRTVLKL
jgi:hypothetical protein